MPSPLPTLTLFRIDGACSLVAHITLYELAIPFTATRMIINPTTHKAEAADGSLSCDDYARTINPNGQVPALKVQLPPGGDDSESSNGSSSNDETPTEVVINENPAILMYIADLAAPTGRKLAGTTVLERAQVASWLSFLSGSVHGQGYGALYRPRRYIDGQRYPEGERAVKEAGRRSIDLFYRQVEDRLAEDAFAVGGALTVVDFNLYLFYRWGRDMGIKMGEMYPKWTALARKLEARGSVKTAVWVEGIGSAF